MSKSQLPVEETLLRAEGSLWRGAAKLLSQTLFDQIHEALRNPTPNNIVHHILTSAGRKEGRDW